MEPLEDVDPVEEEDDDVVEADDDDDDDDDPQPSSLCAQQLPGHSGSPLFPPGQHAQVEQSGGGSPLDVDDEPLEAVLVLAEVEVEAEELVEVEVLVDELLEALLLLDDVELLELEDELLLELDDELDALLLLDDELLLLEEELLLEEDELLDDDELLEELDIHHGGPPRQVSPSEQQWPL